MTAKKTGFFLFIVLFAVLVCVVSVLAVEMKDKNGFPSGSVTCEEGSVRNAENICVKELGGGSKAITAGAQLSSRRSSAGQGADLQSGVDASDVSGIMGDGDKNLGEDCSIVSKPNDACNSDFGYFCGSIKNSPGRYVCGGLGAACYGNDDLCFHLRCSISEGICGGEGAGCTNEKGCISGNCVRGSCAKAGITANTQVVGVKAKVGIVDVKADSSGCLGKPCGSLKKIPVQCRGKYWCSGFFSGTLGGEGAKCDKNKIADNSLCDAGLECDRITLKCVVKGKAAGSKGFFAGIIEIFTPEKNKPVYIPLTPKVLPVRCDNDKCGEGYRCSGYYGLCYTSCVQSSSCAEGYKCEGKKCVKMSEEEICPVKMHNGCEIVMLSEARFSDGKTISDRFEEMLTTVYKNDAKLLDLEERENALEVK